MACIIRLCSGTPLSKRAGGRLECLRHVREARVLKVIRNRQLRMCLAQGNICRAFEHVLFGARLRRAPARLERAPASPRALSVPAR